MSDLISRQDAIRKYQEVCNGIKCGECPLLIKVNTEKGSHLITDCKLEAFLHDLPSASVGTEMSLPKWIPCSERLPDACGKYLVTMKWNDDSGEEHIVIKATWYGEWDDIGWDLAEIFDVVAWMPLPEPYNEQTERSE